MEEEEYIGGQEWATCSNLTDSENSFEQNDDKRIVPLRQWKSEYLSKCSDFPDIKLKKYETTYFPPPSRGPLQKWKDEFQQDSFKSITEEDSASIKSLAVPNPTALNSKVGSVNENEEMQKMVDSESIKVLIEPVYEENLIRTEEDEEFLRVPNSTPCNEAITTTPALDSLQNIHSLVAETKNQLKLDSKESPILDFEDDICKKGQVNFDLTCDATRGLNSIEYLFLEQKEHEFEKDIDAQYQIRRFQKKYNVMID
jgi:hypothetical protein